MKTTVADLDVAWFEVGRGTSVVLIHGLGDDHRAWRRTVSLLMLEHRVLLYDFRGHGGTSLGVPEGSLRQLSHDLVGLLQSLGTGPVVLAGFSLGGTIAMRTALDAPDLVAGLALVGTSSRVNAAAAEWYRERAQMVHDGAPELRAVLDQDTGDVYRNRPDEIAEGLLIRRQATADPRGYANACRAMAGLREDRLEDALGVITVPTVILAGDVDQHCPPRAGEIIADRIKGSELRILSDTGHPLPVERPAEVADAITRVAVASY